MAFLWLKEEAGKVTTSRYAHMLSLEEDGRVSY
jgi:hypothetical protein